MKIKTIECKNVKCYLLKISDGYLMFDAGWPHQYRLWKDNVKTLGISIKEINIILVSHFHIDHAGLLGTLIANGKEVTIFQNQVQYIDQMEELIERKGYQYQKIDKKMLKILSIGESRNWLKTIGIEGEIIQTYGHGDQCISLLLDTGEGLVGDLPLEYHYDVLVKKDWDNIYKMGVV
jgi:endoribonuclease LACTB2